MDTAETANGTGNDKFEVTFWGVRGSYPQCNPAFAKVGGHTSCVSLEAGGQFIILDAGTGIIDAGHDLVNKGMKEATLLVSHPHADHISGLAFFKPLHMPGFDLSIISGKLAEGIDNGIQAILSRVISPPYFPLKWGETACHRACRDVTPGTSFSLKTIKISTIPLNHPGGSCGYRIEQAGKSLCYITDMAHVPSKVDHALKAFIKETDLLIYDAMFSEEEFTLKPGWGHSTWNHAVALAQEAEVGALALFHHSPEHDDDFMNTLEKQAQGFFPATFVARQGSKWMA